VEFEKDLFGARNESLEGSRSYIFIYIGPFSGPGKDAKLLKINGRGERI
jgi:hypothetical protein